MAIPNSAAEAAEVLGVAPGADAEAVRKRYRELAMRHHPDLNPDDPQADQRMAELNRARDLLAAGVPLDARRQVETPSPPPKPQSPAERAETHRAFRDEMERARRADAERAQRRRAARRRARHEAEQRAQREAEESRRPPPEARGGEREDRRRATGANSGRSARRRSADARRQWTKPRHAPASSSAPPIDRIAAALEARGWVDAAAAIRERYRGNGGVAPASVELVLSVMLDDARFDAALVVAAPGMALAAPLLDQAMQRALEEEVPFAFAMNERMFRQVNVRQRTRTNPTTMARFPSPDELREALSEHFADSEADGVESGGGARDRGPANFGRLFR